MTDDTDAKITRKINATVRRITPLLRGLGPEEMGGTLADLVGRWLGGTFMFRDDAQTVIDTDATDTLRRELFADWCDLVRSRIEVHAGLLAEEHGLKRDRN
jgi:hypothetical protein